MSAFNIVKRIVPSNTFRTASIISKFDLNDTNYEERFIGDIEIDYDTWNIGLIYGNSGTGKTVIAKEIFSKDYIDKQVYKSNSVIDDFQENINVDDIIKMFCSCGFSSPTSWLKPYSVLSGGEQMRVDLSRALLETHNIIVFDEFTSVVDRDIAKFASVTINKVIKRMKKKFVAVSCHEDIIEWLCPDWTFCTNNMIFERRSLRRPKIKLEIYKEKGHWGVFRKYHYLNHNLNAASDQYVMMINNKLIALCAVIHQPHNIVKNLKRIHRLVVLPDYQGMGIGGIFLNYVAKIYHDKDFALSIVTSNPALLYKLRKDNNWILSRAGKCSRHGTYGNGSFVRNTYTFKYIGNNGKIK
jgi:ABC-type ATPase with predicted acetyltransferase domain